MRLLDWQVGRHCSPITDIAYLIFAGTDYETRKEHFKYLMDFYHQSLGQKLSFMDCDVEEAYPKHIFEEHLKKLLPYGLFMSFMLLPAVLGEAEDVADMDVLLQKETIELDDIQFVNKESASRFTIRMTGVCQTFIDMGLIWYETAIFYFVNSYFTLLVLSYHWKDNPIDVWRGLVFKLKYSLLPMILFTQ